MLIQPSQTTAGGRSKTGPNDPKFLFRLPELAGLASSFPPEFQVETVAGFFEKALFEYPEIAQPPLHAISRFPDNKVEGISKARVTR